MLSFLQLLVTVPWATRRMWVCVSDYAALPAYARQLVDHLRIAPA